MTQGGFSQPPPVGFQWPATVAFPWVSNRDSSQDCSSRGNGLISWRTVSLCLSFRNVSFLILSLLGDCPEPREMLPKTCFKSGHQVIQRCWSREAHSLASEECRAPEAEHNSSGSCRKTPAVVTVIPQRTLPSAFFLNLSHPAGFLIAALPFFLLTSSRQRFPFYPSALL